MTLENLPPNESDQIDLFGSESTLLPAASPAPMYQSPENVPVLPEKPRAYGKSSPELLASFDRPTRSWRTSQLSLLETEGCGLERYLETWPRSGMMRNGIASRLPVLVPLTGAIASGLLPTPTSSEGASESSHNRTWSTTYASLQNYAMKKGKQNPNWPTPKAADSNPAGGQAMLKYNERTGRRTLMTEVQKWPTPIDPTKGGGSSRSGSRINETPTLHGMARKGLLWPTPSAQESQPTAEMIEEMKASQKGTHERLYLPGRKWHTQRTLSRVVHTWPTPDCQNHRDGANLRKDNNLKKGGRHGVSLHHAVAMWPTPKASPSGPDYARAGREGSGGDDLATAIAKCPTPSANDWKISSKPGQRARQLTDSAQGIIENGGQLNPTWVEWLMGFPTEWSALKPSETP